MKYFICHHSQMWVDNWTYGDWRQYVCNRPGGETQCARLSSTPYYAGMLALIGLSPLPMALWLNWMGAHGIIYWKAAWLFCTASGFLLSLFAFQRTGYRLMKAVGPMNRGAHRVMPGEEK